MIDAKYLKLILAIDKYGSLNKASKELHLSQSALSHQLKNLEDYLGVAIFHRAENQLFFTEAGNELKRRGATIIGQLDTLENAMLEYKESIEHRYIHGYSPEETKRLNDQATSITDYLHFDSIWEKGSRILEVGCGVGSQTEIIADKNPNCHFYSIDISNESLEIARNKIELKGLNNVEFHMLDVNTLNSDVVGKFDHVFVCFLLEHLSNPTEILVKLKNMIKSKGTITVIEGDHGSTFFHPENSYSQKAIKAQVDLQKAKGGNANIGRELYPLLSKANYKNIVVSPRQIYVDQSKPQLVEGFIKNTFTAMIKGIKEEALTEGIMTKSDFDIGIEGLLRTAVDDGVFSYTFFKAKGEIM